MQPIARFVVSLRFMTVACLDRHNGFAGVTIVEVPSARNIDRRSLAQAVHRHRPTQGNRPQVFISDAKARYRSHCRYVSYAVSAACKQGYVL